ncbi:immunoglobulin-like domain-containing protein [Cellulosilyticum sp. I15G10I2]|uniref:immunoglobulin-like domain-containing protein n=1 Tax=Cellulosilyticum sp. I15G10I2 TaxID=1892843 RepID=UPI00085C38D6|nr:immunoglobulin-like domain-containing protein [Cellulosilyticum sp. I15G10I2]
MKKYFCLLVCMVINLILLSGCGNYGNSNLAKEPEHIRKTADLIPSAETTDWKPTTYDTVNNFPDVTMTVKEEMASSTGLIVVFENKSDNQCIYGEHFLLEKKINERWYQVPVVIDGNYGFNDIGYDLASGDTREWTVDWNWLYGSLNTGEYRIVKDILNFRDTGDYDMYYLAAAFIID